MKQLTCEMCGGTDLLKQDGVFICQNCGCKYSVEEAKRMMIEGTVDIQGTVKVDNSAFVEKYLANARRALAKNDWEEVEKYYNMVEQNAPNNMEAVFFSSFGKAMLSLIDSEFYKREQKFGVLVKSISVINEYFEETTENKQEVLQRISDAIKLMYTVDFTIRYDIRNTSITVGSKAWTINMENKVRTAFLAELKQIKNAHPEIDYIDQLIDDNSYKSSNSSVSSYTIPNASRAPKSSKGCYVATAVYGSYDCPQVWTLRRYRDYTLAETWYGRVFIRAYYAISPTLVKWFGHTAWFKKMWKGKLDRMVADLKAQGVKDTPYTDRNW